jgi:putative membrane protein
MDYNYPIMHDTANGWGMIIMLFWAIILICTVIVLLRLLRNHEATSPHHTSPLDIVRERYARGEIKKDVFEQLKKDLTIL